MLKLVRYAVSAAAFAAVVPCASAAVLTFDDLTPSSAFFTAVYNGFSFGNLNPATNDWFWGPDAAPYVAKSPPTSVSTDFSLYDPNNFFEDSSPITSGTPFFFWGAWFSGDGPKNPDLSDATVQYKLYSGNTLVFTSALSAPLTGTPAFYASGYNGVADKLVINGPQGYYAMDNFTYDLPEPSALLLVLAGLGGMGFMVRRRAK